jgi:WhiB family redox-sensing transcriptional regulator
MSTLNVSHVPLPGEWSKRGRCWNQPHLVEQFFPSPHEKVQVKHLCKDCPVRPECLEYALSNPSLQGYWGGMRHEERLRIVERRRVRCA